MPSSTSRAVLCVLLLALISVACGPAPTPAADTGTTATAELRPTVATGEAVPVIASDEPTFEFGTVAPNGSVEHVFELVNRGTADLHIERVERT